MFKRALFLFGVSLLSCSSPSWALRVVSLLPSNTEILEALGATDEVVGVTRFDSLLGRKSSVSDIGDFMHPNVEKIVELKPDLIVAGFWTSSHIVPRFQKMGYRVVQIRNPRSIEEIYKSIRDLAQAVDRVQAAEGVIKDMQRRFENVQRRAAKLPQRFRTYIEIDTPYWTIGGKDYLNEALKLAGADNLFSDLPRPSAQVSPELIVERQPELIVVFNIKREDVARREGWENIPAVKTGAIIDDFSQDILSRPSPGLAAGMENFLDRMEALGTR